MIRFLPALGCRHRIVGTTVLTGHVWSYCKKFSSDWQMQPTDLSNVIFFLPTEITPSNLSKCEPVLQKYTKAELAQHQCCAGGKRGVTAEAGTSSRLAFLNYYRNSC